MQRAVVVALIFALLPASAIAQTPAPQQSRSSGSKIKWIALGGIIGGVGTALLGTTTGRSSSQNSLSANNSRCFGSGGGLCRLSGFGIGSACQFGAPANEGCSIPNGGGSGFGGGVPGPTTFGSSFLPQRRGANWKMIGPAIGAAGVSAFVLYRSHVSAKKAEFSLRSNGAVQLSYQW
jgi:hypothetical protein